MAQFRLTAAAQADIVAILAYTHDRFGERARLRYEKLIAAALRDIAEDPARPGSLDRSELGANARSWHLRGSRERARNETRSVKHPRHLILFRIEGDGSLIIGRILHDAMELERHMPTSSDWR